MTYPSTDISRSEIIERVARTIQRHTMLAPTDRVLVAVSGGADSTALLHILLALATGYGLGLAVAHLNHGLRGQAANSDSRFVQDMTDRLGLTFYCEHIHLDPAQGSLEERGRRARYAFFRKLAQEHGYSKIALGHHMDDNAEVVLMHLLRGSGKRGLGGIPPVRGEYIIRPLMDLRHAEIIAFLKQHQIPYVEDDSNLDMRFSRNRIRHQLIPLLQDDYNANVTATLHRTADLFREEEGWLQTHLTPLLDETIIRLDPDCLHLRIDTLSRTPLAVQRRLIRDGLRKWRGDLERIGADHIDSLIDLLPDTSEGKQLCLPNRIGAERCPSYLRFFLRRGRGGLQRTPPPAFFYDIDFQSVSPFIHEVPEAGLRFAFSLRDNLHKLQMNPDNENTAWFDADQLTFPLVIRNFKPGDQMIPLGMHGHQKIKKILADRKIPSPRRPATPLLTSADGILWVAGIRRGSLAAITGRTRRVLIVEIFNTLNS